MMGAANPSVEMGGSGHKGTKQTSDGGKLRDEMFLIPDSQGWGHTHRIPVIKGRNPSKVGETPPSSWNPTIPQLCPGHSDPFSPSPVALFALPGAMGACPALSQEG